MKVSKIYIKDYNQFKEFTLDLTYPEGHEKAGQPLDKVCFIGQSGTGKTSLLLFLKKLWEFLIQAEEFLERSNKLRQYTEHLPNVFSISIIGKGKEYITISQNKEHDVLSVTRPLQNVLRDNSPNILYFSAEVELQTWGANISNF